MKTSRDTHLSSRYGISVADYDALVAEQGGLCLGCGQKPRVGGPNGCNAFLFIDHNHATGDVRGLLCQACNQLIGLARDSSRTLLSLVRYLERPPAIPAERLVRRRRGEFQRSKTQCANGHPYSPENTYVSPTTGHRQCKTCRGVWNRKRPKRLWSAANGSVRITELV